MAYGKIKADTFVYDNSGSDVEVTVSSLGNKANLNSPTFTGTPVVPGYAPLAGATFTGNVVMSANLTVQGTTTTISSTTIEVADKNLELGKVNTPTDITADGGGITLKGASDKTFNWVDATDAWTSSEHIALPAGKRILLGTTTEGHASADDLTIASTGQAGITIRTGTGDNGSIYFSDGTSGADEYRGTVEYKHDTNSLRLHSNATLALTLDSSQNATFAGTIADSKGNVRSIPQNAQSSAYTLVATDAGKHIITGSGVTIPNNVFAVGDAITIISNSGSDQTITQASGLTIYNAADGSTGNRTLATRGMCTVIFTQSGSSSYAYISGTGLS